MEKQEISKQLVCIDAGHGGYDSGAQGAFADEKTIVLTIAQRLQHLLMQRLDDYIPLMTRRKDHFVSLNERTEITNRLDADIFISLHCNSFVSESPHDLQVYHWQTSQKSKRLAQCIFDQLSPLDGGVSKWSRVEENHNYYVLKKTVCPAVLVELDYISNSAGEALLVNPAYQIEAAEQILAGIDNYFDKGVQGDVRRQRKLITDLRQIGLNHG